ncbi:MAG: hypothetical protein AAB011_13865 [Candidatus Eisenbacteria bacterium]
MKGLFVILAVLFATPAFAGETAKEHASPAAAPAAFERLKGLVGAWQGVGEGGENSTTSFELMSNGSALMERLVPMAGMVMVNLYHPDGDAVVMTHYCASGNQPRMRCAKDGASLAFTLADITNWKKGEARMSAVTVTLIDADHMRQDWVTDEAGKSTPMTMEFVRKK